jgi:hypothetical protein
MTCEDLVGQCFLDEQAPVAVPELNRERTLKYLECCYRQGMSWEDAKQQMQAFLEQRGVPHQGIVRQLQLAKPLLQPWLDYPEQTSKPLHQPRRCDGRLRIEHLLSRIPLGFPLLIGGPAPSLWLGRQILPPPCYG